MRQDQMPQDDLVDPRQREPDIALSREKPGWSPTVDLYGGLARTIDCFNAIVE